MLSLISFIDYYYALYASVIVELNHYACSAKITVPQNVLEVDIPECRKK